MRLAKIGLLCAALMMSAAPAFAVVGGVWNGAARETSGRTYLFKLTMWSETEGIVDYTNPNCRSLVKAVPNAAGKKLFREIVVEGAFSGSCDNGYFELTPSGAQLKWLWTARPGSAPIATGTLTRIGDAP